MGKFLVIMMLLLFTTQYSYGLFGHKKKSILKLENLSTTQSCEDVLHRYLINADKRLKKKMKHILDKGHLKTSEVYYYQALTDAYNKQLPVMKQLVEEFISSKEGGCQSVGTMHWNKEVVKAKELVAKIEDIVERSFVSIYF